MDPTKEMLDLAQEGILAQLPENGTYKVQLSKTEFDRFTLEGFTPADFDGYADVVCTEWESGKDVLTGTRELTLLPPEGGIRYEAGANITEPQTVYGSRVIDADNANRPLGGRVFDDPVVFSEPGSSLSLPNPQFSMRDDALELPIRAA